MRMHQKVGRGAKHALNALACYRNSKTADPDTGAPDPDDERAIGDLIADLLHLAERRGVLPSDMPALLDRALRDYEYESDPDNCMEEV